MLNLQSFPLVHDMSLRTADLMAELCRKGSVEVDGLLSRMIAGMSCFLPALLVLCCIKAKLDTLQPVLNFGVSSTTATQLPNPVCFSTDV